MAPATKYLRWQFYNFQKRCKSLVLTLIYHIKNLTSNGKITSEDGPIVSLTTHGSRAKFVHLAIESIGAGTAKPSSIFLWLDDEDIFSNLPSALKRLSQRGLQIKLSENFGPHTKYYPYVQSQASFDFPLVTADDDIFYPNYWLEALGSKNTEHPQIIHCMRSRIMAIENAKLQTFSNWAFNENSKGPVFLEGVSGVIYPPAFLHALKIAGNGFIDVCPKHDDVWLNYVAIRSKTHIRQVFLHPEHYPDIPLTQSSGLWRQNSSAQGDVQIFDTFSESLIGDIEARK